MLTRIGRPGKGIGVNLIWASGKEVFSYLFLFETDEGAVGPGVGSGQQRLRVQAAFGDGGPDERLDEHAFHLPTQGTLDGDDFILGPATGLGRLAVFPAEFGQQFQVGNRCVRI